MFDLAYVILEYTTTNQVSEPSPFLCLYMTAYIYLCYYTHGVLCGFCIDQGSMYVDGVVRGEARWGREHILPITNQLSSTEVATGVLLCCGNCHHLDRSRLFIVARRSSCEINRGSFRRNLPHFYSSSDVVRNNQPKLAHGGTNRQAVGLFFERCREVLVFVYDNIFVGVDHKKISRPPYDSIRTSKNITKQFRRNEEGFKVLPTTLDAQRSVVATVSNPVPGPSMYDYVSTVAACSMLHLF